MDIYSFFVACLRIKFNRLFFDKRLFYSGQLKIFESEKKRLLKVKKGFYTSLEKNSVESTSNFMTSRP